MTGEYITLAEFEIVGHPMPQGSKTRMPNGAMLDGKSRQARERHASWRQAVATTARDVADDEPHDGCLSLDITFRLPMPASRPKYQRTAGAWPHTVKPDLDKLIRSTLDGLTAGGLIVDDARVFDLRVDAWEVVGWTGCWVVLRQWAMVAGSAA